MWLKTLQARFAVPVSVFVGVAVLGSAFVFSVIERSRIEGDVAAKAMQQSRSVSQLLDVTDALVMDRTRSSMRLLIERGQALGAPSLGGEVRVGEKTVPDLLLGGRGQANRFELVDGVTAIGGGTATLFVRSGEDFVRISTNVKKDNERATGTVLDPKGKAMAAIREGKAFYGEVDILGNPYLTGYEPIRDAAGQTIGIWYVGYKLDLAPLKAVVESGRLLETGFIAIIDGKGKVRFRSGHVTDESVEALLKDGAGWVVEKTEFAAWGFVIVAAYPEAEVARIANGRMFAIIGVGVAACLLLIGLLIFLLRRLVLKPLGGEPDAASAAAARIAAGDLREAIPLQRGDASSMMAAIARMQDSLRGIVGSIHGSVGALDDAAEALVQMAERVSQGSAQQNDATSTIAATLEEITVSIRQVSDGANTVDQMAGSAGTLAGEGDVIVGEAVREMRQSAEVVNQSAKTVEQLGRDSQRVTEIVQVIKEIADQTNLLALNAAIEAARAGEQGRGFAVVADEVRKLAERTALSTQEIAGMISDIQRNTQAAIVGIEDGAVRVNSSVERAEAAGVGMTRIREATESVVHAVGEISSSLKEQSMAAELIARSVEQVANMNDENTAAVHGVTEEVRRLHELAGELRVAADTFRV
ncbi:methyl-accepting chemotaxis protein [Rhodocyclus tenuis]|uniref:Methyl-accepting chemotaxis protein n=1 Tax=Rhodocyclus tenuis TaxID=1066 RepID=A0A840G9N9_RHOTE|nr:methyl-accepting chemotaxis protein [Rhodocyclus tenuis]MBB4247610.1 methyl-accepting chemotaxis protein [Rhodocyclus tenuis]